MLIFIGTADFGECLCNVIGTTDYRKTLNIQAWSFCYMNFACKSPLYPSEFEAAATEIMQQKLHMTKDSINIENAKRVYLHLINAFNNV